MPDHRNFASPQYKNRTSHSTALRDVFHKERKVTHGIADACGGIYAHGTLIQISRDSSVSVELTFRTERPVNPDPIPCKLLHFSVVHSVLTVSRACLGPLLRWQIDET